MMAIDTSLYANFLRPPKTVADYDADARAAQMNMLQSAGALMKMRESQQQEAEMNALRGAYKDPRFDPFSQAGQAQILQLNPRGGPAMVEKLAQIQKERSLQLAAEEDRKNKAAQTLKTMYGVMKEAGNAVLASPTAETLEQWLQFGERNGLDVRPMRASLDATGGDPEKLRQWAVRALTTADKLLPVVQQVNAGRSMNTQSVDPVSGAVKQLASTPILESANNIADNASREKMERMQEGGRQARHGTEMSRPQYIQTEAGLVAVPGRLKTGEVPTATIVPGPGGENLGKPLKAIPASANTAIIENATSLKQLARAITLAEGNDIGDPAKGGQKGDKTATGWKGLLPEVVLNRVDPKGTDTRAEIADIGSLKIHDRSGAAVTISESPRLMPFIPKATDDQTTVLKKLRRLRTEAENMAKGLADTYSKDQGYKPNPVSTQATGGIDLGDGFKLK